MLIIISLLHFLFHSYSVFIILNFCLNFLVACEIHCLHILFVSFPHILAISRHFCYVLAKYDSLFPIFILSEVREKPVSYEKIGRENCVFNTTRILEGELEGECGNERENSVKEELNK